MFNSVSSDFFIQLILLFFTDNIRMESSMDMINISIDFDVSKTLTKDLDIIRDILTRYILAILMILGIFGSLLNLIVFCQQKFRRNSCSVYFIAISVYNLLIILLSVTPVLLSSYLRYNLASYSLVYCKARSYMNHALLMLSRSTMAVACIDRFASCSPDFHIRHLNQRRLAIKLMIIMIVIWLILPSHILLFVGIKMPQRSCVGSGIYLLIYSIYTAIVASIPLIIMIVLLCLIIRNLQLIRTRIHVISNQTNQSTNTPPGLRRPAITLVNTLSGAVIVYFDSNLS